MWQRLTRVVRSFFGFFISSAEDPEIILQQNIRDMNDQVPRMNESIAMVKANVTLLEKEEAKYKNRHGHLNGPSESRHSGQSRRHRRRLCRATRADQGRSCAESGPAHHRPRGFRQSHGRKKAFMREKDRKTQEALGAIADYRRSQWQKKVADVMEQFDVSGISPTHDEMVRKIEETTAVNEARMEMAMGNVDQQKIKIEEEVEKLRANELVKQFKVEMGIVPPEARQPMPRRPSPPRNRKEVRAAWSHARKRTRFW